VSKPHIVTDREGYCKIVLTIGDNVWITIASNSREDAVRVAEIIAEALTQ
jgi:predicted nuclease with TOPRIM domain